MGQWTVLSRHKRRAVCRCTCGVEKDVEIFTLGKSSRSCGHARLLTVTADPGTKRCAACGEEKPLGEFHADRAGVKGRRTRCKVCVKAYDDTVADERSARARERYLQDPQPKIAKTSAYAKAHRPSDQSRLGKDHPGRVFDRVAYMKAWHAKNRERRYTEVKTRLAEDPEFLRYRREVGARKERERRAQKTGSEVTKISSADYATVLARHHTQCWICERALTASTLVWDHYQPLAKGGPHTVGNLRPACGPCNTRKSSSWPFSEADRLRVADEVRALRASRTAVLPDGAGV